LTPRPESIESKKKRYPVRNIKAVVGGALLALYVAPVTLMADAPAAKAPVQRSTAQSSADARWSEYVGGFLEAHFAANPVFAVTAGRHEYDGRLPDFSAAALEAEIERLRKARRDLAAFDGAALGADARFERDYLSAVIDEQLFWRDEAEWPQRNPSWYFDELDPDPYLSKPYAPLGERMRAYIAYARAIPRAAAEIRANLRSPMPAAWAEYGANAFNGYADFYEGDVAAVYASVKDPQLQADLKSANVAAARAMRELGGWLEAQRTTATANFAIGSALFSRMLEATEQVRLPLERVAAIGKADLARNTAELKDACAKVMPSGNVAGCVARVRSHKAADGPVALARRQLPELEAFVRRSKIVSIPSDDRALVELAPPYNAQNFAYIIMPGPYETNVPATYYIAPPDPRWSAEQRAQYVLPDANLLFTSVHEVWPGHFLQFLHSNRCRSRVGQLFTGYAFVEGWGHYSEELMWDIGLHAYDPEAHVGQLLQALWRDVRYVSAIGLHTGRMTVADSERMFSEQAWLDAGNSHQQALRGAYDPAYLNYTLGKLMIVKLRDDWSATRGGPAAWREFHDRLLALGGPPLPLARRALLGDRAGDPL
jgi:hypothetical protein